MNTHDFGGIGYAEELGLALFGALRSLVHPVILVVVGLPGAIALAIGAGIAWIYRDAWVSAIPGFVVDYASVGWMADVDLPKASPWIATILVIALWLPAAILTALLVAAVLSMPLLVGQVARRDFPSLQRRNGGTFLGSAWNAGAAICVFCLLWIATLPLRLLGPLAARLRWMLSAWLNQRLFRYDALAEHADAGERVRINDYARGRLFLLGRRPAHALLNTAGQPRRWRSSTHFYLGRLARERARETKAAGEHLPG